MEEQKILKNGNEKVKRIGEKTQKMSKKELFCEVVRAFSFCLFALMLGTRNMIFETTPLAFGLLAAATRQTPFVLIGVLLSAFRGANISLPTVCGACVVVASRIIGSIFLDKTSSARGGKGDIFSIFARLFGENTYLRIMSGALGVFVVGVWRIIEGGFRFYDLFASIFSLILTPLSCFLFSWYFNITEEKLANGRAFAITPTHERMYHFSSAMIVCALVFALDSMTVLGISVPIFVSLFATLFATRYGIIYGLLAGLMFGASFSPTHAPMFAFCAVAYASLCKLSLFGGAIASCIAGLVWEIYVGGFSAFASAFPAVLSGSMVFCTAERINIFDDVKRFFDTEKKESEDVSYQSIIAEQKSNVREEKLRLISDSFSTLSEIFYNLSSKLKRPTMLDLHSICEESFDKHCANCENRELCLGAEYPSTLEAMKKMTVLLHSAGTVDERRLPESFKKRCHRAKELCAHANKLCAVATKKAFQNEKTEIFALDYDAISSILNDALIENEDDFKIDASMSKKLSLVIQNEGYGEHNVMAFGKRKLRILARGLDLSDKSADVGTLKNSLEKATRLKLTDPSFELSYGSVNMQIEAERAFSAESAFATSASEGESVCGDTVSIFENKNDYLYALISDGMGTGKNAALTSEMCNAFLRNMLTAGNKMETSLRMLNSVLRAKGSKSENECSATVDLLQFDLYSGALTLVKSGAAPTFVIRRENVFKLASPSFPIGILRALDAKQLSVSCEDGDIIIMISDGATRQGDDCSYLSDLLREPSLASEPPSKIADKILRRAKAESDIVNDDISVIVVKIKKELCAW